MDTPKRTAGVYGCKDSSRHADEGQWYAEVVSRAGEDDEVILYATRFYPLVSLALVEAVRWMNEHGVREEDW